MSLLSFLVGCLVGALLASVILTLSCRYFLMRPRD